MINTVLIEEALTTTIAQTQTQLMAVFMPREVDSEFVSFDDEFWISGRSLMLKFAQIL